MTSGSHRHSHEHAPIEEQEGAANEYEILETAIRELLVEKGIFTAEDVRRQIELMESRNPALGAKVVARAWMDSQFKQRLLAAPLETIQEEWNLELPELPRLRVLENRPTVHNVVVCTLCSCYPRMLLGIPPAWYKAKAYRSRVVRDPRGVLREFGLEVPSDVEIRVSDSTADLRYLVLPMRPMDTEGWDEGRLAEIVTRDCMIGTAVPRSDVSDASAAPGES